MLIDIIVNLTILTKQFSNTDINTQNNKRIVTHKSNLHEAVL